MGTQQSNWQATIFNPTDKIAFKERVDSPMVKPFHLTTTQFFIANPVKAHFGVKPASLDNIAAYKNIVVEFDGMRTPEAQLKFVNEAALPYALATSSGNKSIHFIVSITDGFPTIQEYNWFVRAIYFVLDGSPDPKCRNANRLTRVPNSIRAETGRTQELLVIGKAITKVDLYSWLLNHRAVRNKFVKFQRVEADAQQARLAQEQAIQASGPTPIPNIYKAMLERGELHPNANGSRHDSLVKFGAWLTHNGYGLDELEAYLTTAQEAMGMGKRADAIHITQYFARHAKR